MWQQLLLGWVGLVLVSWRFIYCCGRDGEAADRAAAVEYERMKAERQPTVDNAQDPQGVSARNERPKAITPSRTSTTHGLMAGCAQASVALTGCPEQPPMADAAVSSWVSRVAAQPWITPQIRMSNYETR